MQAFLGRAGQHAKPDIIMIIIFCFRFDIIEDKVFNPAGRKLVPSF